MKPNHLAALVVFGSFVLLACTPVVGMVVLWTASRNSDSLLANYLMLSAPVGLLAWVMIVNKQWNQSESRLLRGWSVINTVVLTLDVLACFITILHGCISGLHEMRPPGG